MPFGIRCYIDCWLCSSWGILCDGVDYKFFVENTFSFEPIEHIGAFVVDFLFGLPCEYQKCFYDFRVLDDSSLKEQLQIGQILLFLNIFFNLLNPQGIYFQLHQLLITLHLIHFFIRWQLFVLIINQVIQHIRQWRLSIF